MNLSDRLAGWREKLRSSLWFVPGVLVLLSVVLAVAMTALDREVEHVAQLRFVFGGSPEAGRSILSVIAGSMISLTALVFSILIVVFQLTSSQFTPRALRTFLQDRSSKVALGVFLATFAYALTVTRAIRQENGDVLEFVPRMSITLAFVLALVSMGVFVYYIHHVSQSIRISSILQRIHRDSVGAIERMLPDQWGEAPDHEPGGPGGQSRGAAADMAAVDIVRSKSAGYVTAIRTEALLREATRAEVQVRLLAPVGTFISCGRPLLGIGPQGREADVDALLSAIHLGQERTMEQDIGFGFRQLADIAVRALSPGVNDPTTAVMALDRIEDLLLRVGRRRVPEEAHADEEGRLRLYVPRASWDSVLHEALSEIVHYGKDSPQVLERLGSLATALLEELPQGRMRAVNAVLHREPPAYGIRSAVGAGD